MPRPPWDQYFMELARLVATRSTCLRRQVGAVLVRDKTILATGYNGAPRGLAHCGELGGCYRDKMGIKPGEGYDKCRAVHAEQNAVAQAARVGVATEGSTLYVTTYPCGTCAKLAINAGVQRIVYGAGKPFEFVAELLTEAAEHGIDTEKLED